MVGEIKWRRFLRADGRKLQWSLWHRCDENNVTNCGWTFDWREMIKSETRIKSPEMGVCVECFKGRKPNC